MHLRHELLLLGILPITDRLRALNITHLNRYSLSLTAAVTGTCNIQGENSHTIIIMVAIYKKNSTAVKCRLQKIFKIFTNLFQFSEVFVHFLPCNIWASYVYADECLVLVDTIGIWRYLSW